MEKSSRNLIYDKQKLQGSWFLPLRTEPADVYYDSNNRSSFSPSMPGLDETVKFKDFVPTGESIEDEVIDPLNDDNLNKMGNLLPSYKDDLFAGLVNDFDFSELEDDLFGSGGGLEIELDHQDNISNGLSSLSLSNGIIGPHYRTVTGEHPFGEHPSRTLFVRNINSNVEDSELMSLFEQYGDIRTLYTACKHRGFVMISYYDIRCARTAMRALQNKPLRRRKLDIHFSIPKDNPSEKDVNQGTLVVFNLDSSLSNVDLRKIFGVYGELKEIRETPHKRHHKFIEYYDIRAAEVALKALNKWEIAGKRIKLEPSRPGGANSPPGKWCNFGRLDERYRLHNYGSGLASVLPSPISKPMKIAPIGKDPGNVIHANSAPDLNLNVESASTFSESKGSSIETLSGPEFLWGSPIQTEQTKTSVRLSPRKGHPIPMRRQGNAFPYTTQHKSFLGSNLLLGSAPSGIPLQKHFGFFPASSETSCIDHGVAGAWNFRQNWGNRPVNVGNRAFFAANFFENGFPSSRMMSMPEKYSNGYQIDNKRLYQLDLAKIVDGEDNRTTLMIKNIPNKYTSKMLLAIIDETHAGKFDFIYLPIDFKNRCNVGYAFINMTSPSHIISFYEAFNGKKWEKFNSEKVVSLAFARIQGKTALIMHFQTSSSMNEEDKHCRPIVIQSEGLRDHQPENLPTGNLNILIRQPDGSYVGDSLDSPKCELDEQLW